MRVVCQRVSRAGVSVDDEQVAVIGRGLLLLVGVAVGDGGTEVGAAVDKIAGLRVFPDHDGRMNLSVQDVAGEILVVSQFTLLGDARKGRRPSYGAAAAPDVAAPLVASMATGFRDRGIATSEGVFGARMDVDLVNDGPVTLILDFTGGKTS
ncbi:MAG TPA: D-aminoacyl-tRNA deacylase [Acidimicrobiia bacterium]|nr:D-aminoacyl-tRNA deacylase [Acidimicrobiia bacterium]